MLLSQIKKFAKKRAKNKTPPSEKKGSVYGMERNVKDLIDIKGSVSSGGDGDGGGDGGGE